MTLVTFNDDRLTTTVSFPYDADAVALLKNLVPGWDRNFDPETKTWRVGKAWRPKLTEALTKAGHQVRDAADDPPPPPKPAHYAGGEGGFFGIDDDGAKATAAALVESIKPELRGAVFREMGKILYPDMYPKRRKK